MVIIQFFQQLHQQVVAQLERTLVIVVEDLEVQEDLVVEVVQETPEQELEVQVTHLQQLHLKELMDRVLHRVGPHMVEVEVVLRVLVVVQLEELVVLYKMDS
jgi:hypothetical protein